MYEPSVYVTSADNVISALARLRKMKSFGESQAKPGEPISKAINRLTANGQQKSVRRYFIEFIPDYERKTNRTDNRKSKASDAQKNAQLTNIAKLSAYNLRPAYATIAWQFFKDEWLDKHDAVDAESAAFFADMLGHNEDDAATAQSYQDFTARYIDIKNPFNLGEVISAQMLKE